VDEARGFDSRRVSAEENAQATLSPSGPARGELPKAANNPSLSARYQSPRSGLVDYQLGDFFNDMAANRNR
jgi:hypothetical protein